MTVTAPLDPRYPIGEFVVPWEYTAKSRTAAIEVIAKAPVEFRIAVAGLSGDQLDTAYRPGGWTIRQVIHHMPDSHMNAYVRLRMALTEDNPVIRPYDEDAWAELSDAKIGRIRHSLALLDALHERWTALLRSLPVEAFSRTMTHPARGAITIDWQTAHYAWHSRHHLAHITALRRQKSWF